MKPAERPRKHRLNEFLLDDKGNYSFSIGATLIILAFVLFWDTYLVLKTQKLPNLTEQALFIPILYIVKKASTTTTDIMTAPSNGVKK